MSELRTMKSRVQAEENLEGLERALGNLSAGEPAFLHARRREALAAFRRAGLPHAKAEEYSYVRTAALIPYLGFPPALPRPASMPALDYAEVQRHLLPECRESRIVLVDGIYAPELSRPPQGLILQDLSRAGDDALLAAAVPEDSGSGLDAPGALARAFAPSPLLIRIPDGWAAPAFQILHLYGPRKAEDPARLDAHVLIHCGKSSQSRVAMIFAAEGAAARCMLNTALSLHVGENASLDWLQGERLPDSCFHLLRLQGRLERNSRFSGLTASQGTELTRKSFSLDLAGEGAEASLFGVAALTGKREAHHVVELRHRAPHGISRQHFKSVVADRARASVNGTIQVDREAQRTDASQLINNLMLSDEARADTKPRLMIFADDVKCSHGATVGQPDPEQLFYLESRGLTPSQARSLMTVAFLEEIVQKAGLEGMRRRLEEAVVGALKGRLEPVEREGGHERAR